MHPTPPSTQQEAQASAGGAAPLRARARERSLAFTVAMASTLFFGAATAATPSATPPSGPPMQDKPKPPPAAASAASAASSSAASAAVDALTRLRSNTAAVAAPGGEGPITAPPGPQPDLSAVPAAVWRWRVDGAATQAAPLPGWVAAAQALDQRRGQPSPLKVLPRARQIDIEEPGGRPLARLWVTEAQLLWCPAGGAACRLAALDATDGRALLQGLPAAGAGRGGQPPKRDSR